MEYKNDTIESKLKTFKGHNIIDFLELWIEYFVEKRANSQGLKREHYQTQLDITGKALAMYKNGTIF